MSMTTLYVSMQTKKRFDRTSRGRETHDEQLNRLLNDSEELQRVKSKSIVEIA